MVVSYVGVSIVIGVPLQHPFEWDFPLSTIHFGVPPIYGNSHVGCNVDGLQLSLLIVTDKGQNWAPQFHRTRKAPQKNSDRNTGQFRLLC